MAELQGLTFLFGGLLGAGGVGNDSLTLSGIAAGTPVCGQPTLTQNHSLGPNNLAAGTPVCGQPTVTLAGMLEPLSLTAGTPLLGTSTLTQNHSLTASGLATTAPVCGTTALTQNHSLAPSGLATGSPVVGTTILAQNHSLTATGLVAGSPVLQGAALIQNHVLGPSGLAAGTPVCGVLPFSQGHVLNSASLTAGQPVLGSPALLSIPPIAGSSWWIYWYSFKVMTMQKNQAGQSITMLAIDTATGKPKTGDAANLTAYISKDDGAVTALGDTSATETSATNAKGLYTWSLTQAETNAGKLVFSGKSATADVELIPVTVYTTSEIDAAAIAVAVRSELAVELARIDVAISTRTGGGSGGTAYSITVTDGVLPLDGVAVWVTTDEAGTNAIAGPVHTNAMGQAVFALEPGSYYAFCQRSGTNFTNPQPITVA
jgi:hypothetical protein